MFDVCVNMQLKAEVIVTRSDSYCTVYVHPSTFLAAMAVVFLCSFSVL